MERLIPPKLERGDCIAVIAPSNSMSMISEEIQEIAYNRFTELGFELKFGRNTNENDGNHSSSIHSRIEDLHWAFSDPEVKAILTVIGGYNSNQLLRYIDWEIIWNNPKIFCGFSDITVLSNAIYAKTGLVTYCGPHYSTFGQLQYFDYTLEYFKKCLMSSDEYLSKPSENWSDDLWFLDQMERNLQKNNGYISINDGVAQGTLIGGNLGSLRLLQGTEYFPDLNDSILMIEDTASSKKQDFDRELQSLIHLDDFTGVKGIIVGRFQNESNISQEELVEIFVSKKELKGIPIIAGVDFGHTDPKLTLPIGGRASISCSTKEQEIKVINH
jgi:muramoyltetrapeptide carboxypeptidase LdcA involved in peptidoglycan recycling